MTDEQIQGELVDEEIQAEPVIDEWILARQAEIAEYEDRRVCAVNDLKQLRAAADDRDARKLTARFAEARRPPGSSSSVAEAETQFLGEP